MFLAVLTHKILEVLEKVVRLELNAALDWSDRSIWPYATLSFWRPFEIFICFLRHLANEMAMILWKKVWFLAACAYRAPVVTHFD